MIIEYHRPHNLNEALALLARKVPTTKPLAGGTIISHRCKESIAVVDLQTLGLKKISCSKKNVSIGAMVTLQEIVENPKIPQELRSIAQLETSRNLRNMGTLGGCIVTGNGRSMINAALLCLDAVVMTEPGDNKILYQDWLNRKKGAMQGNLITSIEIKPRLLKFVCIRKTPKDLPLISVFVTRIKKDALRIVIGGNCSAPFTINPVVNTEKELAKVYTQGNFKNVTKDYFCAVTPVLISRLKEEIK